MRKLVLLVLLVVLPLAAACDETGHHPMGPVEPDSCHHRPHP